MQRLQPGTILVSKRKKGDEISKLAEIKNPEPKIKREQAFSSLDEFRKMIEENEEKTAIKFVKVEILPFNTTIQDLQKK